MKTLSHKSFSKDGDNTMKQKHIPVRCFFYLFGMLVLAMGLILNIKAGLGSSAIMSVAYTISEGAGVNLGDMTFVIYCLFIAAQMAGSAAAAAESGVYAVYEFVQGGNPLRTRLSAHRSACVAGGHCADRHWCRHDSGYAAHPQFRRRYREQHSPPLRS